MIRFYIGLWASKFLLFLLKIIKKEQDDKPGLLAYRFHKNFMHKINKPEIVIAVTGTNGKTTASHLIAMMYKNLGKKVCYNDWGANQLAGHARCLLDCVTIFNKPKVDVVVLETDELTAHVTFPAMQPNYVVVTNICRDSIRRNANTYHIFRRMQMGVESVPNATLILNADCPISSFLGYNQDNKKVYYGVKGKKDDTKYIADDFAFCPKCYSKIEYVYRQYRHIGQVKCPKCGFKSLESDYLVTKYSKDKKELTMKTSKGSSKFPTVSSSIFNIYNQAAVITLFKEDGYKDSEIKKAIKGVKLPKSRENIEVVNGIEVISLLAKGQNVSACSTVFRELGNEKEDIAIVFLMNEMYGKDEIMETVTWYYETDFEFLNKDHVKQILFAGPRNMDYKLRLKLAGFKDDKYTCIDKDEDLYKYIDYKNVKKVYFLYEVEAVSKALKIKDNFCERIKKEMEENES